MIGIAKNNVLSHKELVDSPCRCELLRCLVTNFSCLTVSLGIAYYDVSTGGMHVTETWDSTDGSGDEFPYIQLREFKSRAEVLRTSTFLLWNILFSEPICLVQAKCLLSEPVKKLLWPFQVPTLDAVRWCSRKGCRREAEV